MNSPLRKETRRKNLQNRSDTLPEEKKNRKKANKDLDKPKGRLKTLQANMLIFSKIPYQTANGLFITTGEYQTRKFYGFYKPCITTLILYIMDLVIPRAQN